MARSKKTSKFEFKGFVNIWFTHEEQEQIKRHLTKNPPDLEDSIVVMSEAEYKIGISYDEGAGAYNFTATCKYKSSPYYGYCFCLRHVEVTRGLGIMRNFYDKWLATGNYEIEAKSNGYDW